MMSPMLCGNTKPLAIQDATYFGMPVADYGSMEYLYVQYSNRFIKNWCSMKYLPIYEKRTNTQELICNLILREVNTTLLKQINLAKIFRFRGRREGLP